CCASLCVSCFHDAVSIGVRLFPLHDALPISTEPLHPWNDERPSRKDGRSSRSLRRLPGGRRPDVRRGSRAMFLYLHGFASSPQSDRKSTLLNSSHVKISYAVFCSKKKS